MRSIVYGILASFFFAVTFVLNRAMELSGGSWIWSASLRYFFMVPFLLLIVGVRGNLRPLLCHMREKLWVWIGWSFVGFGLFYAPLCFAAAYGPGWLVAGTWQITIVSGSLLVPLFYKMKETPEGIQRVRQKIPLKGLLMSLIILIGVGIMQAGSAAGLSMRAAELGILPVIIASFAYPLGNRKMMQVCEGKLDAYQRVLGMTLASLPLWIVLSFYELWTNGAPGGGQVVQSLIVAISSGVVATVLFFAATDLVKGDVHRLAAVEATQSGEIVFAVLGEILLLKSSYPSAWGWAGIVLIIVGMVAHSLGSHGPAEKADTYSAVDGVEAAK
ncbi:multidrug resistance efflux transporter family protein [Aneurinibacillus sp. Ricciae_BoGa-3]|uniref:DMT family transporter n=1 Tax=Aneurinibacillus sp. Ricciae_BoGa-3 TaxID=3022697 RepID=UPI0023410192|nr:multidrug resistance efflux transporter family protein [Aneurinibacillus sp. Ricciae_BoGa-3]WCK55527.1 multidrug resistance efflux transporter family protein [Aneurinibacillus sp. Ricciae_BoGa-3]